MDEKSKVESKEVVNRPELNMRISDIKLTLWNNNDIKSFNLEKIYKVEDVWKSTKSFNMVDIDKLIYLLTEFKRTHFVVDVQRTLNQRTLND